MAVHVQDLPAYHLLGAYNGEVLVQKEYDENLEYDYALGDNVRDDKTFTLWPAEDQGKPAGTHPQILPHTKAFQTCSQSSQLLIRGGCAWSGRHHSCALHSVPVRYHIIKCMIVSLLARPWLHGTLTPALLKDGLRQRDAVSRHVPSQMSCWPWQRLWPSGQVWAAFRGA